MVKQRLIVTELSAHLLVEGQDVLLKDHRLHGILHEHDGGEHASTSRDGSNVAGHIATGIHIHTSEDLIAGGGACIGGADINDSTIRLQHVSLQFGRRTLGRNDIVGILQEIARDGVMSVGQLTGHILVGKQKGDRETDAIASSNDGSLLLFQRKLVRLDETQSGQRRSGEIDHIEVVDIISLSEIRSTTFVFTKLQQTTLVGIAATIHILDGRNGRQDSLLVDRGGKRALHHNTVDGSILVEKTNALLDFLRLTGGIKDNVLKVHSTSESDILLLLNETLGICIVAEAKNGKTGGLSSLLTDVAKAEGSLLNLLVIDSPTVKNARRVHAAHDSAGSQDRHGL